MKFISLNLSLVFLKDVGQKMLIPLGKLLVFKEAEFLLYFSHAPN